MVDFGSFPQFVANGVILGAVYALAAFGFSIVFYSSKIMNFAQGAVIALSAHLMWFFFTSMEFGFWPAVFLTLAVTTIFGLSTEFLVFGPLRKRNATNAVFLVASISLLFLIDSLLLIFFGADLKAMSVERSKSLGFFGARITELQVWLVFFALAVFVVLWIFLNKTKAGKTMRAVSENKDLAEICGANPQRTYFAGFFIASFVAGIAGILIGFERNVEPLMGNLLVISAYTGVVIGGVTSIAGAFAGSVLLGLAENLGIIFLPSGFRFGIAFSILFLFLVFRPQGLFGKISEVRK